MLLRVLILSKSWAIAHHPVNKGDLSAGQRIVISYLPFKELKYSTPLINLSKILYLEKEMNLWSVSWKPGLKRFPWSESEFWSSLKRKQSLLPRGRGRGLRRSIHTRNSSLSFHKAAYCWCYRFPSCFYRNISEFVKLYWRWYALMNSTDPLILQILDL